MDSSKARYGLFTLIGFTMNLSIGAIYSTSLLNLRWQDARTQPTVSVTPATLFNLIAVVFACRLLWAPAADLFRTRRWTRRTWLIGAQVGVLVSMVVTVVGIVSNWKPLILGAFVLATAAQATLVVTGFAFVVAVAPADRMGTSIGLILAGQFLVNVLGAIVDRAGLDDSALLLHLAFLLACGILLIHLLRRTPYAETPCPVPRWPQLTTPLVDMARSRNTWVVLLFALAIGLSLGEARSHVFPLQSDGTLRNWLLLGIPAVVGAGVVSDRLDRRAPLWIVIPPLAVGILLLEFVESPSSRRFGGESAVLLSIVILGNCVTSGAYALFAEAADRRLLATTLCAFMGALSVPAQLNDLLRDRFSSDAPMARIAAAFAAAAFLLLFLWRNGRSRPVQ